MGDLNAGVTHLPPQPPNQPAHDKGAHLGREAKFTVLGPEKAGKAADSKEGSSTKKSCKKAGVGVVLVEHILQALIFQGS